MKNSPDLPNSFEAEITGRFGLLPNFFQSAAAAPGLTQELWGFAKDLLFAQPYAFGFQRPFAWI